MQTNTLSIYIYIYTVVFFCVSEFVMKNVKVEDRETGGVVNKKEREIKELLLATMEEAYRDFSIPELLSPVTTSVYEKSLKKSPSIDVVQRERDRRAKMAGMFSVLQSIVPNLLPKMKKEQIVAETIQFIRRLEEEKGRLERIKESRMPEQAAMTVTAGNNFAINVTVAGEGVVFFGIELMFRRGLASEVFSVFERCGAEVLAGTATVNGGQQLSVTVTAMVSGDEEKEIEKIKAEILEL